MAITLSRVLMVDEPVVATIEGGSGFVFSCHHIELMEH